jgi:hypothetical protein
LERAKKKSIQAPHKQYHSVVDCLWECKGSTQKAGGDEQSGRPTCGKEVLVTRYKICAINTAHEELTL